MQYSLPVTCVMSVGSQGTPVSSTNKTDHQDITEILLKVALSIITVTPLWWYFVFKTCFIWYILVSNNIVIAQLKYDTLYYHY
jgi:hypothetical protein